MNWKNHIISCAESIEIPSWLAAACHRICQRSATNFPVMKKGPPNVQLSSRARARAAHLPTVNAMNEFARVVLVARPAAAVQKSECSSRPPPPSGAFVDNENLFPAAAAAKVSAEIGHPRIIVKPEMSSRQRRARRRLSKNPAAAGEQLAHYVHAGACRQRRRRTRRRKRSARNCC